MNIKRPVTLESCVFCQKSTKYLKLLHPTKNVSEYLDYHLKPIMQSGFSYIRDSGDFLKEITGVGEIPENALLVKADAVGLYPSNPHKAGLTLSPVLLHICNK